MFLCILKPEAYAQKLDRSKTPAQLHIMNWHPDIMTSSMNNIDLTKKKNMFRFDTFPVLFFLCAMFGVTISGCQLCGVNMKDFH